MILPRLPVASACLALALLPSLRPGMAGTNHLAGQTSPYLLEHLDNPVDWYPWGDEALRRARAEDRPIFLSIGYSACHWCHVMERESFEDTEIAAVLNARFVPIKVDREERPDLDRIYMAAVVALTGGGGWPMSVFVAPNLQPFFGATYLPRDRFLEILNAVAQSWDDKRDQVLATAGRVQVMVERELAAGPAAGPPAPAPELRAAALGTLRASFDRRDGGFGTAPKFPPYGALAILLRAHAATGDEAALDMAVRTLDAMARGGLHDQIGGGFHRYSTDARWFAPHFEKMLYDNALLAPLYLEAWKQTGRDDFRRVAEEALAWAGREMTDPDGAFYATLDADSEGEEGRFYLWTTAEVRRVLGDDEARLAIDYFGMTEAGNFGGGRNILYVPVPLPEYARRLKEPEARLRARLDADRARLLAARDRRPRPRRDEKILTAWNGLMISAMARAAQITKDDAWRSAAGRAATAVADRVQAGDGRLRASWTAGRPGPPGYLDDYAFLARADLDLYETTGRRAWLDRAAATVRAGERFRDAGEGGFFFTSDTHPDLIARAMELQDTSLPSGNAVMAECLIRLADALGETGLRDAAARAIRRAAPGMRQSPVAYASTILAAEALESPPRRAAAATGDADPGTVPGAPAAGSAAGGIARGVVVGRANAERVVEGAIAVPALKVRPGQAVTLTLDLSIRDGWHVNSNTPTLEYLIPTRVTLPSPGQATVDSIDYPAGKLVNLEFAREKLSVYEGKTTIRVNLRPSPDGPQGARAISLRIGYQACSHKVCLAPETLEFSVPLTVEGEPVPLSPAPADAAGAGPGGARTATDGAAGFAAVLAERGLPGFLVLIFLAGLALDLTPCVYPLVPVTISFFAGQASGSWGRRIALPSLYVLGMALTYSVLGVVAGLSGGLFGATLQNPWIVGALVLLFAAMALSMFGLFEFRMPGILTRFGGGRRGPIGALVMGLTMGIVAAPCIGPFVVGLLAFVGASGKPFLGFWLFFVMALGMGLPFLVLGVFSGALANLPRSGGWLIYAKKIMGIGLLAVALYFLQPFLSDRVLGGTALSFGLAAGLYLAFLERTRMAARWFPIVKSAIGAAVVVMTLWVALPLVQTKPGPEWKSYSREAHAAALASGKPVIIDFFADWCVPCKELDRFTFSDPRVLDETRRFVLLKVDLTQFESSRVRQIRDRFEVIGVPTIIFTDSRGNEPKDLRLYGFEEVPAFLARLQKVR